MMQNYFRFHNDRHRLTRMSYHDKIREKRWVLVPGCQGDPYDRGQPGRFDKWYRLPRTAHRLFWKIRKMNAKNCQR